MAETFLQSPKCPFTVGVIDPMKVDPFNAGGNASARYRVAETADIARASFTQQSGDVHVSYSVSCSAKDPAKWLARYGGDQDAVCKRAGQSRNAELQANRYCALSTQGDIRVLLTGSWAKDPKHANLYSERAKFTAAEAGKGSISGQVSVTSGDDGEARKLAEQLIATLALRSQ